MIPGYVAGHYQLHDCHIDLCKLSTFAQAALVRAAASHIDTVAKQVCFQNRPPIEYDCLSINIGITSRVSVPGLEFVTPVKPIDGCGPVTS
jgi:selenide, water dikinase